MQKLIKSENPVDRATATTSKLLGQDGVWLEEWTWNLKKSRRVDRIRRAGYTTLGDLWSWPQERWMLSSELKQLTV